MLNKKKYILAGVVVTLLFLIDKISKDIIVAKMNLYESIPVIKNLFSITYAQNTGAGFSILEGQFLFFYIITILVTIYLLYLYFREENTFLSICYLFIIGGSFGNFYDRLRYQYVIDFLHFQFGNYHFPIFNLADSFICVGVFLLLLYYIRFGEHNGSK